jgi:hypothetical protein
VVSLRLGVDRVLQALFIIAFSLVADNIFEFSRFGVSCWEGSCGLKRLFICGVAGKEGKGGESQRYLSIDTKHVIAMSGSRG